MYWRQVKLDNEDGSSVIYLTHGDAIQFVTRLVTKWDEKEKEGKSKRHEYEKVPRAMAREMLNKMKGDPERLAILQYAVSKKIISRPPLHVYVEKGELDMLQWHCDTNKCDLRLPLSSSEETASFFSTYCDSKYWGNEAIISDAGVVTVAEALCVIAVCQGEFPVFQYLMREKVDNKGFFVNGMNMLHLAAVNNNVLMVKWLVYYDYIPIDAKTAAGANALHLAYLSMSRGSVITFLDEELPGAIDSEGHDYNWYRRAKLKREQPDVDWDRNNLVLSQLRKVTRMVEDGVDFCEVRNLLENGALGDEISNETTWSNHEWHRLGNHASRYFEQSDQWKDSGFEQCYFENRGEDEYVFIDNFMNAESGADEQNCDENSFVDWFYKFVKRAIKFNREECLQWLLVFYRQRYCQDKRQKGAKRRGDNDMQSSLLQLIDYALWVNQPTVAALFQAEMLVMKDENKRRRNVLDFDQSEDNSQCLRSGFVCGVTVEEILERFSEKMRLLGTLTLTAGDVLGLTMEKLTNCDNNFDCSFYLHDWGPRHYHDSSWPLSIVVWEGHLHLVKWLLSFQQLHKNIDVLLQAISMAVYRPATESTEMLPLLLNKLQMIEEQRDTLDSPPDQNVIVRALMKAILVCCGAGRDRGQGGANLSRVKLLLPVLQSYGVDINTYWSSENKNNNQSRGDKLSILMMTVKNLLRGETTEGWELLRWILCLPGLRHDSEVAVVTGEWRKNELFTNVGQHSCLPDRFGIFKMDVIEQTKNIDLAIRLIDYLLKSGCFDLGLAIEELTQSIVKELSDDYFCSQMQEQKRSLEEYHVTSLRYLAENWGVDLRPLSLNCEWPRYTLKGECFELLKQQQRERWFMVEALEKNDAPLRRLQTCKDLPSVLTTTYKDKCTLLHVAAKYGCTEVITWVMEHYVDAIDAEAKDILGRTAISFAHSAGFTAAEQAMQNLGATQTIRRFCRQTAMRLRCVKMAELRSSACTMIQTTVRRYQVREYP